MSRGDRTPCRVVGCEGEMRQGQLMCQRCWNRVPASLQRMVRGATRTSLPEFSREALAFVAGNIARRDSLAKLAEEPGSAARLFKLERETEDRP